jgi:hypothetical protein
VWSGHQASSSVQYSMIVPADSHTPTYTYLLFIVLVPRSWSSGRRKVTWQKERPGGILFFSYMNVHQAKRSCWTRTCRSGFLYRNGLIDTAQVFSYKRSLLLLLLWTAIGQTHLDNRADKSNTLSRVLWYLRLILGCGFGIE